MSLESLSRRGHSSTRAGATGRQLQIQRACRETKGQWREHAEGAEKDSVAQLLWPPFGAKKAPVSPVSAPGASPTQGSSLGHCGDFLAVVLLPHQLLPGLAHRAPQQPHPGLHRVLLSWRTMVLPYVALPILDRRQGTKFCCSILQGRRQGAVKENLLRRLRDQVLSGSLPSTSCWGQCCHGSVHVPRPGVAAGACLGPSTCGMQEDEGTCPGDSECVSVLSSDEYSRVM